MHISYIPQLVAGHILGSLSIPCWVTSPLHMVQQEPRVLFIHTPDNLPEHIGAAIINELSVFGRQKTLLYSLHDNSVGVVKRLMEQMGFVETLVLSHTVIAKEFGRFANAVRAIEKTPLYINDRHTTMAEMLDDIRNVMADSTAGSKRHRIVVIDEIMSLKDMAAAGNRRETAGYLRQMLRQMATEYRLSFVVMSSMPLHGVFPRKDITTAYVTMRRKEYEIETILI